MPKRYRDRLRQAEADLAAAYDLYRCGHWSWCCFICQQSAEKSIKAILEYYGRTTRGHNLVELIKEVENMLTYLEKLSVPAIYLTDTT